MSWRVSGILIGKGHFSKQGPGESLINPRLDEILRLVRANSACDIVVTTNGVLVDERLTRIFLDCGVTEVSISLDSIDAETFRELRVNGELEKVQRAIDLINEEKKRRGTALPRLNLTPTFFRQNIRELPGFVGFAARNGVHQLQVSPGQVYREDWVENSLLGAPELTRRMASKAEKRARELGVTLINNLRLELRQAMLDRTPPEACRKCYEFNRHRPDIMISLDAVPEK